jgi:hypothetical protein
VYGLQTTPEGSTRALYRKDVLVGPDIQDERATNSTKRDDEVLYDFLGADPDTLQPRLFIRERSAARRSRAPSRRWTTRRAKCRRCSRGRMARAAVLGGASKRCSGTRLLGAAGRGRRASSWSGTKPGLVVGLRNTEAVQLLRLAGDPTQPGGLVPIPVRVVVRDRSLILDPVLLGTEGLQYQTRNNAAGLPESPDQVSANIRIALAMEGPLAIPGLRETLGFTGAQQQPTAVHRSRLPRWFNAVDSSADLARGFIRDPLPLRVVGEIVMYLERVDRINAFTHEVTIFKNGVNHEIDSGDVLRFVADNSGVPVASSEVVSDPEDDRGQPVRRSMCA